jgi:hypothetical protein
MSFGYARASSVAQNSRRGARTTLTTATSRATVAISSLRPDPPLCVAQRGALLHHVAPGHGARRVPDVEQLHLDAIRRRAVLQSPVGNCQRPRSRRPGAMRSRRGAFPCAIRATAAGHHAGEYAARLGPVKAFRADCRRASTPDGAIGLDRPFGRAGSWLLRDGQPTTDFGDVDSGLEPQELDAVVAFVRILLEWDDRARRMKTQTASQGAADDDRDERIESRGAVCAGVE